VSEVPVRPRAISLFSGAGGLDLGLREAGFQFLLANDNDGLAAEAHRLNFPGVPFHVGSVKELTRELIDQLAPTALSADVDLVTGGPPCPPFSKSRFYRTEMARALDDPVGWETITGYLDVLRVAKPRAFLLENVPGLAFDIHAEALNHILAAVQELGYRSEWRILNAADFGVPQIRQRFFLVGMRAGEGLFRWPEPTHSEHPDDGLFTLGLPAWTTAGDAIGDLDTETNASDEGHFAGGKHHDLLAEIPPGDNYLFYTAERGYPEPKFRWRSRYWSFLLKLSPKLPSWTIQARRSNNMGPLHWRNRILRIDEVKRLQTFPDDWKLVGSIDQQWRQVGNAVPPLLARRLGEALVAALAGDAATLERS
jgi:DNA (cytosine-5)-methyltransferase 1